MFEKLIFHRTVSATDVERYLKDCDWVIDVFFIISDYGCCAIVFCFIDTKRFNTYPSLFNILNVFIEKFREMFFFFPFEECGQEISVALVIILLNSFKVFVFPHYKLWVYTIFLFSRILQSLCNHGLVRSFSSFLLSFLSGTCVSNRPST